MSNKLQSLLPASQLIRAFFLLWAGAVLLGGFILLVPEPNKKPLIPGTAWEVTGGFSQNSKPRIDEVGVDIANNKESTYWRSWSPEKHAEKGHIESAPFAIHRFIAIPYVGYPAERGISLYLECVQSGARLNIAYGNAHEDWVERTMWIPGSWCTSQAKLVANSTSDREYIGLGTPFRASPVSWLKESVFTVTFIHAIAFISILLPGLSLFLLSERKMAFNDTAGPLWIMPLSLLMGYLSFFSFYYGQKYRFALVIACIIFFVAVIIAKRKRLRDILHNKQIVTMYGLFFLVSLFYVFALYSVDMGTGSWDATYRFAPAFWSSDNQLSQKVAETVYNNRSILGLFGLWRVSDRPPLLSGLMLLLRPTWTPFLKIGANSRLLYYFYQITGIIVMTFWVIPVWFLFHTIRGRRDDATIAVLAVGAGGFAFFNSIYIWPKLLAAALGLCVYIALVRPPYAEQRNASMKDAVFAGLTAALAMLSHGGAFFGLLALGGFLLVSRYGPSMRQLAVAALLFVCLMTPWIVWQHIEDPPGNALAKFAFAGTFGFGQENIGLLKTVKTAYSRITFGDWMQMRWEGVRTLWGSCIPADAGVLFAAKADAFDSARRGDFLFLFPSLRFLNMGWFIWLFGVLGFWKTRPDKALTLSSTWLLIGLSGIAVNMLLTWCEQINHYQSYLSLLLIVMGLVGLVIFARPVIRNTILALHFLYFITVWTIKPMLGPAPIRIDIAVGWLVVTGALVAWTRAIYTQEKSGISSSAYYFGGSL